MSMSIGLAHGLWSLAVLGAFVAVVIWAWRGNRRSHFEEAGRIPFREDSAPTDGTDRPAQ